MNLNAAAGRTLSTLTVAFVCHAVHAQPARPPGIDASAIVDLTHEMHEGMPYWPGGEPFTMTRVADYPDGFRLHTFQIGENTGTHVDAPAHFFEGAAGIDDFGVESLIVPAVVVNVEDEAADDPDYALSAADVERWEARHGRVPAGAFVILNTGWHERFAEPERYVNLDDAGVMHFPGFSADAAELLVERDVAGLGIDTLSIDPGPSTSFAAHAVVLGAGKYQIENLANVDRLPPTGASIIVGVLPVRDGTQAQARVLALLP